MNFLTENLQILATLGSALAVYVFLRIGSKKEAGELRKDMQDIKDKMETMQKDIKNIDIRLSKLEGRFEERGYWQSRESYKTGTEDRK